MLGKNDLQAIQEIIKESEDWQSQNLQLLIENYFDPKFKILAEGHKTLLETLAPKNRVDELAEEVSFLKSFVSMLNKEVNELKKAM